MSIDRYITYQKDGVYGVQLWFEDGYSIRQEGFENMEDAKAYAEAKMTGEGDS